MPPSDQQEHASDALEKRLTRLSEASMSINETLDFDTVLQGVLDSARSLTYARYGVMTLLDDAGQVQDFLSSGLSAQEAESLWIMPDGPRIFEALTNISEPVRVPDLAEHVHALGFTEFTIPLPVGVFRFMAAPMSHRGVRGGLIFVGDREDGQEFTRSDEEILVMFASQAALVIANARTHQEERRARTDLETLVDTSPVGVVVLDAQTGIPASLNREALRMVEGLLDAEQAPQDLLDVVTCVRGDGHEVSLREFPLAELLRSGKTVRAEEIILKVPDGRSVSALLNATPIQHADDGQVASFIITLQDMTPLEEQERLRAEFLAMVSHELRTPLAAVKGSITTLLDAAGDLDPAETAQFHRIIRDQSDHMRHLIGELLDVARIETGALPVEPEPSDMHVLVQEAGNRFRSTDARNPMETDLAVDLPMVMADRIRIIQVLSNLLSNAAAYSPDGSPITVSAKRDGVHVEVSVTDQGRGIPAELMPELFRKFSRSHHPGSGIGVDGSGLGLAICKGIVEAHGGRIQAESDGPGLGACFTFTLPAIEQPPIQTQTPATATDSEDAGPRRTPQLRILAVDDNPQDLRYIRDVLTRTGYAPIPTSDPADVPRLLSEEKPHLALLDLVLPGSDGVELMNDIRKTTDIPVIFLSMYGQDETIARALDMGASDYLVKPFSPTELAARIRAALRKRLEPFQAEPSNPYAAPYAADGLSIDYARRQVTIEGNPVDLTATEYAVLYELAVHAPRVLSHNILLQRIWGPERVGEAWLVRNIIKRLRDKLGDNAKNPKHIKTHPRVGYHMPTGETESAKL